VSQKHTQLYHTVHYDNSHTTQTTDSTSAGLSPMSSMTKITYFACRGAAHAAITRFGICQTTTVTAQCSSWSTCCQGYVNRHGQLVPAIRDISTAISFFEANSDRDRQQHFWCADLQLMPGAQSHTITH